MSSRTRAVSPFRSRFRTDSAAARVLTSAVVSLDGRFVRNLSAWLDCSAPTGCAESPISDLTAELALALGSAAARRLGSVGGHARRVAVVGRDPRASGEMLEAAVIAGLTSEGVDALRVGVLPTPAVAYLTSAYDADFGVMISASHNPMPDNGIKIFGAGRPQARRRHRGPHRRARRSRVRASGRSARPSAGSSTPTTRWTATCATPARRSPPGSTG